MYKVVKLNRVKQILNSIKNKMEEIEPYGLGEKYDNRSIGNDSIGDNERCIGNSLLHIRWKIAGNSCVSDDGLDNFVKLLCN